MAADSLLAVAVDVVRAVNDKQQLQPMPNKLVALSDVLGKAPTLLAGNGYFSAANVAAREAVAVQPLIAMRREAHYPSLSERFAEPPPPKDPAPVEAMAYRLATPEGKKLYRLRKQMPEPVFGIVEAVLGFRLFPPRGIDKVRGERSLVTMAWNLKRMFAPCLAP